MKLNFTKKLSEFKRFLKNESKFTFKTVIAASLMVLASNESFGQGTTLVPYSGSNTVACGVSTRLMDHAGTGNYSDNANGFTVIDAGFAGVINIQGSYNTESCCDPIYIYSGAGTSGPLLQTYIGTGNMNYTGTSGQTLTVQFYTDGSVTYAGFDFTVTSTGACFSAPCSGTPGSNTVVVTPTAPICPGASAFLALGTPYTVGGLTYQWQSSTVSAVGPFTSIPGATVSTFATPSLTAPVYYTAVITCTNSSSTYTTGSTQVLIQGNTISNVPYYEDFEGILNNNDLPNCSWTMSAPNTNCRTYTSAQSQQRVARSGQKFASFFYSPSGANYFYTNGIQMEPGITYSASVWFKTNYYGDVNWSDLSIMLGTSQSTTGLVTIASTNGPAASTSYKSVSNTFTVANSGVYYVAIQGISDGGCCAYHLNWDDLLIEAPCSINGVSVNIAANTTTICSGDPVILTASGADNYTWSHGPTTAQITEYPVTNTIYSVMGTNSITGCMSSSTQFVVVNETPQLAVFSNKQAVCLGESAVITALGASTYTWNTNSNSNFITVSPSANTTYTVLGAGPSGCVAQISQAIAVNALPVVTGNSDRTDICVGETATLTASGATSYQWSAPTLFVQAQTAFVSPMSNTTYSLTGTDNNGCMGVTTVVLNVQQCVGLKDITTTLNGVKLYPNPNDGMFTVELNSNINKTVEVIDMTGRVISSVSGKDEVVKVDISQLANGIYYVKIKTDSAVEVIKVNKN